MTDNKRENCHTMDYKHGQHITQCGQYGILHNAVNMSYYTMQSICHITQCSKFELMPIFSSIRDKSHVGQYLFLARDE